MNFDSCVCDCQDVFAVQGCEERLFGATPGPGLRLGVCQIHSALVGLFFFFEMEPFGWCMLQPLELLSHDA